MFFELMIKGFIIGFAFVIPGVSGGTLAVYLGVYEKLIHSIGNIFKEFKKSLAFLFPLFLGVGISVVALAKLFDILLKWNSFIVIGFFLGLIIGGIKNIYKEVKNSKFNIGSLISFSVAFGIIVLLIVFSKFNSTAGVSLIEINIVNIILVFLLGFAASMTMIIPGISGSALLIVLGFYTAIVSNVVGNIFDFSSIVYNLQIIIPFGLGALVGIILTSKVIGYVLNKYKTQTYFAILGFVIASCFAIFFEIRDPGTATEFMEQTPIFRNLFTYISNNIWSVIIGLITFGVGFIAAKYLSKLELKGSN